MAEVGDPGAVSYLSLILPPTARVSGGRGRGSGGGWYRFQRFFDLKVKTAPQTTSINISILSSEQPILGAVSFAK